MAYSRQNMLNSIEYLFFQQKENMFLHIVNKIEMSMTVFGLDKI